MDDLTSIIQMAESVKLSTSNTASTHSTVTFSPPEVWFQNTRGVCKDDVEWDLDKVQSHIKALTSRKSSDQHRPSTSSGVPSAEGGNKDSTNSGSSLSVSSRRPNTAAGTYLSRR
ncbi:hypothetical protein HDV05_000513 [Chytridiales sp. JEL 0842]|nr:hypothetical protein HDV05_000513 [Chytridiales sp. JEL 0842]